MNNVLLLGLVLLAIAVTGGVVALGPLGGRPGSRLAAWTLVGLGTASVERLTGADPASLRMVVIILALLWSMKAVVAVETRRRSGPRLGLVQWLAFAQGWPGMRPDVFVGLGCGARDGAASLVWLGLRWLALGGVLVCAARAVWVGAPLDEEPRRLLATVPLLVGLSLCLHFGVFNLLAGVWRAAGADTRPLFRDPLRATSLSEFWSRRWNLAFSEMTAIGVYRPLTERIGRGRALLVAFACSGVLHELAISLPVNAGFGRPMAYFAIQGGLVLIERRLAAQGRPIDADPRLGRAWTLLWLVLPLPILFHAPFLNGAVWPLIGAGR